MRLGLEGAIAPLYVLLVLLEKILEGFMPQLTAFIKKLRIGKILPALMAGIMLFLGTACNPANAQGARPNNLPVQMGGNNNSAKNGGDEYNNLRVNPNLNLKDQSFVAPRFQVASSDDFPIKSRKDLRGTDKTEGGGKVQGKSEFGSDRKNALGKNAGSISDKAASVTSKDEEILYPGGDDMQGRIQKEKEFPIKTAKNLRETEKAEAGGKIQREDDLGDRLSDRLETVKDTFGKASEFITDKADEAGKRPEMQPNPALKK